MIGEPTPSREEEPARERRFGGALREARVACGLSLREAAALLGSSVVCLGAVERGVASPRAASPGEGEALRERIRVAVEAAYRHGYGRGHDDAEAGKVFLPEGRTAQYMEALPMPTRALLSPLTPEEP